MENTEVPSSNSCCSETVIDTSEHKVIEPVKNDSNLNKNESIPVKITKTKPNQEDKEAENDGIAVVCESEQEAVLPEVQVTSEQSFSEKDIETIFGSPYHKLQQNVFVEGNMISYVAPNFNELLKNERVESPGSSWTQDTSRSASSESLWSTNSGWSSELKRPGREVLPLDPAFLADLEKQTQKLSANLTDTFNNFISHTGKMSFYASQSLEVYKESVDKTCDTVDNSIKSMYALMAKCEELHECMKPVYQMNFQIKELKRVLDILEMQILSEDIK